jgi:hypothetical protein
MRTRTAGIRWGESAPAGAAEAAVPIAVVPALVPT